jgi:hypothetical protein
VGGITSVSTSTVMQSVDFGLWTTKKVGQEDTNMVTQARTHEIMSSALVGNNCPPVDSCVMSERTPSATHQYNS